MPLQFAAVVDVVVARAVDVAGVDAVVAAMTATAHPAGSLTGMTAPAGGELLLPAAAIARQLDLLTDLAMLPMTLESCNLQKPHLLCWRVSCSYENEKRGGGGRGNWGAADGT